MHVFSAVVNHLLVIIFVFSVSEIKNHTHRIPISTKVKLGNKKHISACTLCNFGCTPNNHKVQVIEIPNSVKLNKQCCRLINYHHINCECSVRNTRTQHMCLLNGEERRLVKGAGVKMNT